ncbi:MAG: SusC/RagA family TonB-linked outer membrane protein, partial [Bacteroidetes bacterium]|nr:SusC/RagA family TonB-linked outer membrane protein [Bacteroidota bacterium]
MKLTGFLLFMALFQVQASGLAQTIRLEGKDMPLKKVFAAVEAQTGYMVVYNQRDLLHATTVSVNVRDMPLTDFLQLIMKEQPLTFSIQGKTIVLSRKEATASAGMPQSPPRASAVIKGKVVDEDGKPLEGATIFKKNTSISRLSNAEGQFTMNVDEGDVLVISYVEHKTREIKISASLIASGMISITLAKTNSELDALRIIAYGTDSRRVGVGAVSTVTSAEISDQPVSNPLAALSGLAPGLNIGFTSGAPGAAVKVQIRGQNSLSQSSFGTKPFDQPLFIVNGVPVAAQNFNINALNSLAGSNYLDAYGGTSPFNGINPEDIESITVLRDAAATAIYGTQGANGVILITTKKGKAGKTRFSASVNTAFNTAARKPKLLNTGQYIAYRKEALANDGIDLSTATPTDYPDLLLFDQNKYTDWVDYYLGKTSGNLDAHASASGGSERTTFFLSGGYTHSNYSFPGDFDYNRVTLHSNIHHGSTDGKLTIDFGFDYAYERNYSSASPYAITGIMTPPDFPDLVDAATGKLNWTYKGFNTGAYEQYAANIRQPNVLQAYNMTNSLAAGYAITRELKLNINVGYSRITSDEAQQQPASSLNPANNPVSTATFGKSTFETINIEPQLNYQHSFGRGVLTALAGGTYRRNNATVITLQGSNYTDEALLGSIGAAGSVQATDSYKPYRYAGAFARLGYVYDQKYIIQLSGRRDGSSNFGPGRQFGNFSSVGAGWIFSGEQFFKDALRFISYGKLSGSYGTTGTDATLPYQYQQLFSASSNITGFQGVRPLNVQNLFNPDYGWDTKKSWNIGLDLGF